MSSEEFLSRLETLMNKQAERIADKTAKAIIGYSIAVGVIVFVLYIGIYVVSHQ